MTRVVASAPLLPVLLLVFVVLFLHYCCCEVSALQRGDRMPVLVQSLHDGWLSPWLELSLSTMPRFRIDEDATVHVQLPQPSISSSSISEESSRSEKEKEKEKEVEKKKSPKSQQQLQGFNKNEDIKVSLTFSESRIILPNIILFDADEVRSLQSLLITFVHDEFNVVRIEHEPSYGLPIRLLDTSHPSLTAFSVQYRWESAAEEDFSLAVSTMFALSAVVVSMLAVVVYRSHPLTLTTSRISINKGVASKSKYSKGINYDRDELYPSSTLSSSSSSLRSANNTTTNLNSNSNSNSDSFSNRPLQAFPGRSDGVNGTINGQGGGLQYRPSAGNQVSLSGSIGNVGRGGGEL